MNLARLQYFKEPSTCFMVSSVPQTQFFQEVTVSNKTNEVQSERNLSVFIKLTPAAARQFPYVYRLLAKHCRDGVVRDDSRRDNSSR